MNLTPEQKKAVSQWVAAGETLSTVQKKLAEEFQLSLTYRDVRFLVDDLDLELKDAAPRVDANDVTKAAVADDRAAASPGEKKGLLDKAKEKLGLGKGQPDSGEDAEEPLGEEFDELADAGSGTVTVTVDKLTVHPGAVASGTVTFSDGVSGKWIVDQYGRPGLMDLSKPGYRPSASDGQAFMHELSVALQKRGF